jgi:hypothetical protein
MPNDDIVIEVPNIGFYTEVACSQGGKEGNTLVVVVVALAMASGRLDAVQRVEARSLASSASHRLARKMARKSGSLRLDVYLLSGDLWSCFC